MDILLNMREVSFINKLPEHYKNQNKDVVFLVISHYDTPKDFLKLQNYLEDSTNVKGFRERYYNER
ncbi:hypothetical protein [Bernardetia sp.]|uniref:hypothetical protein n=1 Tax=Bernardetia sp. TaxID=1937974 RepID=UPI0025C0CF68|nr:hypothetical protein [Bernardetia sp.]